MSQQGRISSTKGSRATGQLQCGLKDARMRVHTCLRPLLLYGLLCQLYLDKQIYQPCPQTLYICISSSCVGLNLLRWPISAILDFHSRFQFSILDCISNSRFQFSILDCISNSRFQFSILDCISNSRFQFSILHCIFNFGTARGEVFRLKSTYRV